jgi:hypothetical protein
MNIIYARSPKEIQEVRRLFREYEAFLNVDLCFQQFESELANLPGKYAPPSGTLLLAMEGQRAVGCGALRRLGAIQDRTCEMKRLYVCAEARSLGTGGQIARRLIQEGVVWVILPCSWTHLIGWNPPSIYTNHWVLCARNHIMTIHSPALYIGNWT